MPLLLEEKPKGCKKSHSSFSYFSIRWSQKNPEGRAELIDILKKAGREQGLVGLKTIALVKGKRCHKSYDNKDLI